jgi:hypothetical protein
MNVAGAILSVLVLGWAASVCVCAIVDELWRRST